MDNTQVLMAMLIVLIITLVVYFNNIMKGDRQPNLLKYTILFSAASVAYLYTQMPASQFDCIWGVSGGYKENLYGSDLIVDVEDDLTI